MASLADVTLFLIVLSDFAVIGTSRLSACIRAAALQGLLLAILPVALFGFAPHTVGLAVGTALIKAVLLPWFLRWAIREAAVRREIEPRIGYLASVLLGAAALASSFVVASVLPLGAPWANLLIPVALVTVIVGLLVLVTRSKALTQVIGYLLLENGIFLFGLTQAERVPFLVEVGVLLDVFVGVFVMGIVLFHINREFDSISAEHLTELHD
jgi:hydrogenase-4 component E